MRYISLLCVVLLSCAEPQHKRNVIVILVDDLGWKDTSVYGSTYYETPAIDRLATEGVRFTQFYAASGVCSPTRASLMTGKHPARLHITNWIGGEQKGQLIQSDYLRALPLEELTIGEAFLEAGYTTGYIGKWHLGTEGFMPEDQGFQYTSAVNYAGQPGSYFPPYANAAFPASNVPDLDEDPESAYLTDRLTDHAIEFIGNQLDTPFFLYLSHYAVHTPLESKPVLSAHFESRRQAADGDQDFLPEGTYGTTRQHQDYAVYAGMIASVDESVGRIMAALDSLDLARHTVVVFTSDNGGLSTLQGGRRWAPTSNSPLRAGKGFLYEGGIRIPFIVYDPSGPQGRLTNTPGTTNDLFPTLLSLAGLPPRPDLDGMDLSGTFENDPATTRALHWHFPHYHGSGNRPSGAIRMGDHKLLEWFEDGRTELYNLAEDPGETTDLSAQMPGQTATLLQALHDWRASVAARMPRPNPDYADL